MAELLESLRNEALAFLGGKAFMVATAVFFLWLLIHRTLIWVKNILVGGVVLCLGILSPLKMRHLLFKCISFVFMVGGASAGSGAYGKQAGGDGVLEAVVGGAIALTIWGFVILLFVQVKELKSHTPKVEPPTFLRKKR